MKLASAAFTNPVCAIFKIVGVACAVLGAVSAFADTITNPVSSVVSYQYPEDYSSEALTNGGVQSPIVSYQYAEDFSSGALTNGGISSPIVSYQYVEWPSNNVLQLLSSLPVSYFYQSGSASGV